MGASGLGAGRKGREERRRDALRVSGQVGATKIARHGELRTLTQPLLAAFAGVQKLSSKPRDIEARI